MHKNYEHNRKYFVGKNICTFNFNRVLGRINYICINYTRLTCKGLKDF